MGGTQSQSNYQILSAQSFLGVSLKHLYNLHVQYMCPHHYFKTMFIAAFPELLKYLFQCFGDLMVEFLTSSFV